MKTSQEIKALFNALPIGVQNELLGDLLMEQELQGKVLQDATESVVKKRHKKPSPHCTSTKVYKRGKQKGVQMYKCNDCNKWYSETTGTPLYDIKLKSKWQSYLNCMEQGMPIKKIAKQMNYPEAEPRSIKTGLTVLDKSFYILFLFLDFSHTS